jgi:hypothetical protein
MIVLKRYFIEIDAHPTAGSRPIASAAIPAAGFVNSP